MSLTATLATEDDRISSRAKKHTAAPQKANACLRMPTSSEVAAMRLDEFAAAGLMVQVHSAFLGCEVLFVSDDVNDADFQDCGLPIYRAAELRKLAIARPRPRELLRIHDAKTIFDGAIDNARPRDDHARREA